jgi:hypothetical protein
MATVLALAAALLRQLYFLGGVATRQPGRRADLRRRDRAGQLGRAAAERLPGTERYAASASGSPRALRSGCSFFPSATEASPVPSGQWSCRVLPERLPSSSAGSSQSGCRRTVQTHRGVELGQASRRRLENHDQHDREPGHQQDAVAVGQRVAPVGEPRSCSSACGTRALCNAGLALSWAEADPLGAPQYRAEAELARLAGADEAQLASWIESGGSELNSCG